MPIHRSAAWAAITLLTLLTACAPGRAARTPVRSHAPSLVQDVPAALAALEVERREVRAATGQAPEARIRRMIALGMWPAADSLAAGSRRTAGVVAALAELRFRQHRYQESKRLLQEALSLDPRLREARLLQAALEVRAWNLEAAVEIAESLLRRDRRDADAALVIGRIRLLQKQYAAALEWAERVQAWDASHPGGHLLEADVRFWDQDPAGAEPSLVRALELDPFDADARFSYGYAIWRRVDARQLDDMAAQWNLALEVDPLHYVTHWHWGNGHTNLTYADYAQPEDSTVRVALARADSLVSRGRVQAGIALAREVQREHPGSVLPALFRGSAFYMAWEMDREARLDSAQAAFQDALARKPNFGPAHNGLAAVIKQRQFTVLSAYDSLEAVIESTPLPDDPALEAVFPDIRYYPGDRVARMARLELGPSIAYLPLIQRQGREYRIPPLHQDLAQAMGRASFRTSTTFDNRQWMDIRGVGSGAAAIEYVERGAHQERNVLLHEFVHLFHGIVFTDAESRRVRDLYHRAMQEDRTLDYYASNNESEFLAQAYPAYLSPVKVHPLNHKSMNTADDLRRRDPETYAWVDSLIARQRRYLSGDSTALASNWAQVYVNLSERARRARDRETADRLADATALLDSATAWDPGYVPAMLSRAALLRDAGRFAEAASWVDRAAARDPSYAPVYAARAELAAARARAGEIDGEAALARQVELYTRALELETDLAERAALNHTLRRLHAEHGDLAAAVAVAESYAATAPTISTYLRDRRDEAAAFAHELRARAGYASESLGFLRTLVARKPQNYPHRAQLADALVMAGELDEAVAVLEDAQRILRAAGTSNAGFAARIAEVRLLQGDTAAAHEAMRDVVAGRAEPDAADLRVARVLLSLGLSTDAHRRISEFPEPRTPAAEAELAFTRGFVAEWRGDHQLAAGEYAHAVDLDPYHAAARIALVRALRAAGDSAEAARVAAAARALPLPAGPDLEPRLAVAAR